MTAYEGNATLSGKVQTIRYHNPDNGWSVFVVFPDKECLRDFDYQEVTVTGEFMELNEGDHIDIEGKWEVNSKFGPQLKMTRLKIEATYTKEGLYRFLAFGQIKGISDVIATAIINMYGENLPDIIENQPDLLKKVLGVKTKKMRNIVSAWKEKAGLRDLMIFLQSAKISNNVAVKVYKKWKELAIDKLRENPYCIIQISNVGFKTADEFALSLGLKRDSTERIMAGVDYALEEAGHSGHTFLPIDEMIKSLQSLIGVAADRIKAVVHENKNKLIVLPIGNVKEAVFLRGNFNAEFRGAENMLAIQNFHRSNEEGGKRLPQIEIVDGLSDIQVSDEQLSGLQNAIDFNISVITGGPGTGKSQCIKTLLDHLDRYGKSYSLAAPTGRAAKRIEETTSRSGMTMHRLLGLIPRENDKEFDVNSNKVNPMESDFFIIDEYSMVDAWLNSKLFEKIPLKAHVLLVGDVDQLPSVGAGNVLRDTIESGLFPVTRLTTIYRQEATSDIITNAHKINKGQFFRIGNENGMYHFATAESTTAAKWIAEEVFQRISKRFNMPFEDIQVLVPMYKGTCGVDALNASLKEKFNPLQGQGEIKCGFKTFRVGDRVMQTKNDYTLGVFNGDCGYIIDIVGKDITIEYDKTRQVVYTTEQMANVVLAYAMTIHKSQGCEYPGIIIALLPEHYVMLQRNLFYTAVTRARTACVVVGDETSMRMAITNNQISKRYTALGWFLKHPAPVVSLDMLVEEPEEVEVVEVEAEADDEDEEEVDAEELLHQMAF